MRDSGLVSCQAPLNHFSRPTNSPTAPGGICFARQSAVCFCPVEVGHRQAAVLGADADLEAVRRAVRTAVLVGLLDAAHDLADHRQQVALVEVVELAEAALAHVAAREHTEQVAHRLDPGGLLDLARFLAADGRHRRLPAHLHTSHGYSTATSSG